MPWRVGPLERSRSRQTWRVGCFPHSCTPWPPQGRWGSGSAVEQGTDGHCALGQDSSWGGGDASGELAQQSQGSWGSKHSCSLLAMLLFFFFLIDRLFSPPYLMLQWFFLLFFFLASLSLPYLPLSVLFIRSPFKHPLVLLFPLTRDGWRSQPDQ